MNNDQIKYDWVPHEVRQDYAESILAYVVMGVMAVSVSLAVVAVVLLG